MIGFNIIDPGSAADVDCNDDAFTFCRSATPHLRLDPEHEMSEDRISASDTSDVGSKVMSDADGVVVLVAREAVVDSLRFSGLVYPSGAQQLCVDQQYPRLAKMEMIHLSLYDTTPHHSCTVRYLSVV